MRITAPHATTPAAIAGALEVDPAVGLSRSAATARLAEVGPNQIEPARRPSLLHTVWDSITEPFLLLLTAAGIGAVLLGETRDGLLVLGGLVPIIAADVVVAYRSERALEELRSAAAPRAVVVRDGEPLEIPAAELVPGDVLVLATGDVVPADGRLIAERGLLVDRSTLTGEAVPEAGSTLPDDPGAAIVDRHSMVYAGTSIVGGRGRAIVTATGAATEVAAIATALGSRDPRRSPLERELDRLVRILLVAALSLVLITVGLGLARGETLGVSLLAGISAAIAAIPEEPPILLAVVLGLGAFRLLRRGVLVRRLAAQETLGAVDLIITDKTGTLTRNRLTVSDVLRPDGPLTGDARRAALYDALRAEEDAWTAVGRRGSFSSAIGRALAELGADPALDQEELVEAVAPGDDHPWSEVTIRDGAAPRRLAIGASEAVLRLCHVPAAERDDWLGLAHERAGGGGRLLLLAAADGDGPMRPVALVGFADILRDDVRDAIGTARAAGIATLVVTGDHLATAGAIADAAGLAPGEAITGEELRARDDAWLDAALPRLRIVARAVPADKLRLVRRARAGGHTVAVTGDGVNDAPALQHADVGVAMGSGTAVAREASDLVLGDDSFATLMDALRGGRRIVANVQKGLVFLVSTHVALLGFILVATLAGFSQPLLPLQILWLELFIDVSASIAFEREPEEPDAMRRPPRARDRSLLDTPILLRIAGAGGFSAIAALAIMLTLSGSFEHVRWVAYTALVVAQAVRAYANRSLATPLHRLPRNTFLAVACLVAVAGQVAIPLVPPLAEAFHASPLSAIEWGIVAVIALLPAVLAELVRMRRPSSTWVA
ncbi:MAG TPA: cation-transporting P-type ATPase [Candidatus Limnocylindria bacterium]|nr:cation-transporting P-type ATPase [Candidatus Limnocylindria bacterium]